MDRRKFLFGAFSKEEESPRENPEVIIGKIADFPVGEKRLLTLVPATIESLPEGLRVQSTKNDSQFYSIKTNQIGELVVNRREFWPAGRVFSILTNEPACLDLDHIHHGRTDHE